MWYKLPESMISVVIMASGMIAPLLMPRDARAWQLGAISVQESIIVSTELAADSSTSDLRICFGESEHCLSVPRDCDSMTQDGVSVSAQASLSSGHTWECRIGSRYWDHDIGGWAKGERNDVVAFVDFPDDWDDFYLTAPGGDTLITSFRLTYQADQPNPPPDAADDDEIDGNDRSFVFVDIKSGNPLWTLPLSLSAKVFMKDEVEFRRRSAVVGLDAGDSITTAGDIDRLPILVREAIGDIGQLGMEKYRWTDEYHRTGCHWYAAYFLGQYSGSGAIVDSAYFPALGTAGNGWIPAALVESGRLYKVVVETREGIPRVKGFKKVLELRSPQAGNQGDPPDDLDGTLVPVDDFHIKPGDYLLRRGGGYSASHSMIVLDAPDFSNTIVVDPPGPSDVIVRHTEDGEDIIVGYTKTAKSRVMVKTVEGGWWANCGVRRIRLDQACGWYIGITDHEQDGIKHEERGPAYGLRTILPAFMY